MYIKSLKISNYRNFANFEMNFHKGLNVIIGSNNSGKTGLLSAIALINDTDEVNFDDFNKNDLQTHFIDKYKTVPPEIVIEYKIEHTISEENTDDESIIKLLPFIMINESLDSKNESKTNPSIYEIIVNVKMLYSLDSKKIGEYTTAVSSVSTFEEFYDIFCLFQKYYSWNFTNCISDSSINKRDVRNLFKVDFINAERNNHDIYSLTKGEIEDFLEHEDNINTTQKLQQDLSSAIKEAIHSVTDKISELIKNGSSDIGLKKGNVDISQNVRASTSISNSYFIDIQDTKSNYILPLSHNGLGYNNLINMYILIKLFEYQKSGDFRILCLEEPEAHLHPAMQYKLFKFLKKLDEEDNLNQQIFVTTHSPNITAVAGLDNMFMLAYDRTASCSDCKQQSMRKQLESEKEAKKHMMKFLDVTRSDMLFADKIIFVEGIAEKLLMPKFMEKCGYPYEDEHVSIVEVGGINFQHFTKLFANNPVHKKILCITDIDFKWEQDGKVRRTSTYARFKSCRILKMKKEIRDIDNLDIRCQHNYGRTFEDELFICNFENIDTACKLLKIALPDSLHSYIDKNKTMFNMWNDNLANINKKSQEKIKKLIIPFIDACKKYPADVKIYEKIFFAELFLSYASKQKGNVALSILVDDDLITKIIVPSYIKEGIQWLSE